MNNAGFLSIENVRENQLNNLSKQIDELREENDRLEDFNEELMEERNRLHSIIKEVREYIEKNWISQKDADNYRFDDEELDIEISDIAVLFDILDKEVN